jgi:Ala-tRNA(Pro) deacylase
MVLQAFFIRLPSRIHIVVDKQTTCDILEKSRHPAANTMNTLEKLKQYLEQNNAPYKVILHEEAYTAQELAQALHTPGNELVKVVIVKTDGNYRMVVLPASRRIDLQALKTHLQAGTAAIATEQEFKDLFPDAEIGAMPPYGNLYDIEVCVDKSLTTDEYITFNAGTHYEAIRMRYSDFERLVHPCVASFSVHV